jgi:signal transduction histidine kinase
MQDRVRLVGGRLAVRSRPGRGTTVLAAIPVAPPPAAADPAPAPPAADAT